MVAAGALKNGFYKEPIALFMDEAAQGQTGFVLDSCVHPVPTLSFVPSSSFCA